MKPYVAQEALAQPVDTTHCKGVCTTPDSSLCVPCYTIEIVRIPKMREIQSNFEEHIDIRDLCCKIDNSGTFRKLWSLSYNVKQ